MRLLGTSDMHNRPIVRVDVFLIYHIQSRVFKLSVEQHLRVFVGGDAYDRKVITDDVSVFDEDVAEVIRFIIDFFPVDGFSQRRLIGMHGFVRRYRGVGFF